MTASVLQQDGDMRAIGIDLQGGKGNANNIPDSAPTLCAISHGTPNGVLLYSAVPHFPFRPVKNKKELRTCTTTSTHIS